MKKVSLLECVEAISLGDMSFNTLKCVTIDGDSQCHDYIWCYNNFAIFKVKIDNIPHIMKICLDRDSNDFLKSFDRCNTFYSNIFVKTDTLFDELNIYSDNMLHKHNITIMLNNYDKKISSQKEYLKQFLKLVLNVLHTNLIIDDFSLRWCVNSDDGLKISLERGGKAMSFRDIRPEMLIAFKNYLLSVVGYIRNHYCENNFKEFIENSPKFDIKGYKFYNKINYFSLYTPANGTDEYAEIASDLYESTNRAYCARTIKSLIELIDSQWTEVVTSNSKEEKIKSITEKYEIIGDDIENRIAVLDKETNKIGFIDENCDLIIKHKYNTATDFEEGVSVVSIDSKFGAINSYGETLVDFVYDELEWLVKYNIYITLKDGLNGIVNRTGKVILEPTYSWIDIFHNSLARYQDSKTSKFGFLSPNGEIAIEAQWDEASNFENGFAKVQIGSDYCKIDINGDRILGGDSNH